VERGRSCEPVTGCGKVLPAYVQSIASGGGLRVVNSFCGLAAATSLVTKLHGHNALLFFLIKHESICMLQKLLSTLHTTTGPKCVYVISKRLVLHALHEYTFSFLSLFFVSCESLARWVTQGYSFWTNMVAGLHLSLLSL
jgi:hypothetical protein